MIFAAGYGTRMGVLTKDRPKPMVPLAGRPMIDHTIDLLREASVDRIVANTHYLRDQIEPHLEKKGIIVSPEANDILDTGGGLKSAYALLDSDTVITMNPDAAWLGSNPIQTLLDAWLPDMQALLLLVPLDNAVTSRDSGDFSLKQGEIFRKGSFLYTGAQILRIDRLQQISQSTFSLNQYWDMLTKSAPLNGIVYDGRWCDIGTPDGLSAAARLIGHD